MSSRIEVRVASRRAGRCKTAGRVPVRDGHGAAAEPGRHGAAEGGAGSATQLPRDVGTFEGSYDPFGLREAVASAAGVPSLAVRVGARLQRWLLTLVAVLPLPLLVVTTTAAVVGPWRLPARVAAVVLWGWTLGFLVHQFNLVGSYPEEREVSAGRGARRTGSVAVVGAGPVGLAAVKECVAAGLEVECYERQGGPGGVFRFDEGPDGGVPRGCTLTTSPWVTAFSDFPPSDASFMHQHHSEYRAYLQRYARHFGLGERIRYQHTVTRVAPDGDGWVLEVRDGRTARTLTGRVDRVAVCTGLNLQPKGVDFPGMDTFTGEIRHAASYSDPEGFHGRRIVVAGLGESGVDVAAEVAPVAAEAYLSIPRGKFIIPRLNPDNGIANDYDTNRIRYASPVVLRNWFMVGKERRSRRAGPRDPASALRSRLLAVSEAGPMSQTVTKNDDFVTQVLRGRLDIRPRIVAFEGDSVVFADGTRQQADVVIFAHGYHPTFPFLELPDGVQPRHPGLLYLRMFLPEIGDRLGFLGFARPAIGAIPPTGELQARLFALVASGQRVLPDRPTMQAGVERMLRESAQLYPQLEHPNVVVSWIRYMDRIAAIIGCRPTWRLLGRPRLLWKLLRGPMTGAVYRQEGPGADPIARDTVLSLEGTHPLSELVTLTGLYFWTWPIALLHPHAAWMPHNTFL